MLGASCQKIILQSANESQCLLWHTCLACALPHCNAMQHIRLMWYIRSYTLCLTVFNFCGEAICKTVLRHLNLVI